MNTCYIGKNVQEIADDAIEKIKGWKFVLEKAELEHMLCVLGEKLYILFIKKGDVLLQINQEKVSLKQDQGIFINAQAAWRFLGSEDRKIEGYLIEIDRESLLNEEIINRNIKKLAEQKDVFYAILEEKDMIASGIILKQIEQIHDCDAKITAKKSLIYYLLAMLFEKSLNSNKKAAVREKEKLYKMIGFLHENYKEKLTLAQMAENSNVSSGEYCRFFKKRMGQTPVEYLQAYRIGKAIPEILEKNDSITEIVLRHGFAGSSYFSETFKKEMGCAPGEYRKWYLSDKEISCPLKSTQMSTEEWEKEKEEAPKEEVVVVKEENEKSASGRNNKNLPAHLL